MIASSIAAESRVSALADTVCAANAEHRALRIVGADTWPESRMIVDVNDTVSTAALDEIIEYVPGDLTITVGGGTSLATIAQATAANNQWLTLDPYGSPDGTIGATIATASWGPLATGFGSARDLVLGIEAITGHGAVIRGGGRVVKNVAGFDLVRLFTGSRGSLGVITEASLRLRARPDKDETLAVTIPNAADAIRAVARAIREWDFVPMAAEILNPASARAVGLTETPQVLLRFGGNARAVAAQIRRGGMLGKSSIVGTNVWDRLRAIDSSLNSVVRLSRLPASFADTWAAANRLADGCFAIGSPALGVVRVIARDIDAQRVRSLIPDSALVIEQLPTTAAWYATTREPDADSLDGKVQLVFNPAGTLNPGIMRLAR